MCSSQVCVEPHGEHRQNVQKSVLLRSTPVTLNGHVRQSTLPGSFVYVPSSPLQFSSLISTQSQTYIPQIATCVAKLMPLGTWRGSDDLAFVHVYQELLHRRTIHCVYLFVRKGARLQRGIPTRSCSALRHEAHVSLQIRSQTQHHRSPCFL